MKIIGVTGGIGAGKSTVLGILEENYGALVIEADKVGHQVMEPGGSCYDDVVRLFGYSILKNDKTIDRKRVSDVVFQKAEMRMRLNALIHPAVKREIRSILAEAESEGRETAVVEAALLLEDHYEEICDEIWYIFADRETRIRRLMESRGYSREKCESIMASQQEDSFYRSRADFVVINNGSPEETFRQIAERLKS